MESLTLIFNLFSSSPQNSIKILSSLLNIVEQELCLLQRIHTHTERERERESFDDASTKQKEEESFCRGGEEKEEDKE